MRPTLKIFQRRITLQRPLLRNRTDPRRMDRDLS
jgi:hypothetical protein